MLAARRRRSLMNGCTRGFINSPPGLLARPRPPAPPALLHQLTFSGNQRGQETARFHIYELRRRKRPSGRIIRLRAFVCRTATTRGDDTRPTSAFTRNTSLIDIYYVNTTLTGLRGAKGWTVSAYLARALAPASAADPRGLFRLYGG